MPNELEERIREALHARAGSVRPDPQTWRRVQARIRRRQVLRWSFATAASFALIAAAAVVVPSLPRGELDLAPGTPGPSPVDQPVQVDPTAPPAVVGASPLEACGALEAVAMVFVTHESGFGGQCVAGGVWSPVVRPAAHPVFTPDGTAVVYGDASDPTAPVLVHHDLATGEGVVIGGGRLPAFAPDGRFARVMDVPGDGEQPRIWVSSEPFSEPDAEIVVWPFDEGQEVTVRRLVWDTVEDRLLYETIDGDGDSRVLTVDGDGERHELIEPHRSAYAAPAVAPDGTVAVLSREGGMRHEPDPGPYTALEIALVDRSMLHGAGPDVLEVIDLSGVDGLDVDSDDLWLAATGAMGLEVGERTMRWVPADRPGWLMGDGVGAWFVGDDGVVALPIFHGGYRAAAANPAVDFSAAAAPPPEPAPVILDPQTGLPADVEVTRQRLHAVASARDWGGIEALMAQRFTSSFSDDSTSPDVARESLQHSEASEPVLDVLLRVLEGPYGTTDSGETTMYVWPRAATRNPADWDEQDLAVLRAIAAEDEIQSWRDLGDYLGWRAGIDGSGAWRFYVAGD